MSYRHVIPRDLFNEANLLKCYGQLWILLDTKSYPNVILEYPQEGEIATFDIRQNESSGGIYIRNVHLMVGGQYVHLERPLNSREKHPLYATTWDDDVVAVFDKNGDLSEEMHKLLQGKPEEA